MSLSSTTKQIISWELFALAVLAFYRFLIVRMVH